MFKEKNIHPMLLSEIPFNFSDDYLYEIKFDGIRAIIYASPKSITIKTRNNIDVTHLFPELFSIKDLVTKNTIFDGEIVLLENNKPSFSSLQKRLRIKNEDKINTASINNPVTFVVFDILYLNKSLLNKKLIDRKKILDKFKDTEYFVKSKVFSDGENLFRSVRDLGLEGIVAKEKTSLYYPNIRTKEWIKLKNIKQDYFYIGGFIKNKMSYSLLLGEIHNNKLYYVGKIKVSNKSDILSIVLKEKITPNNFVNYSENGKFIKPKIKIKINYLEKTKGNMLRHPFM